MNNITGAKKQFEGFVEEKVVEYHSCEECDKKEELAILLY